MLVPSDPPFVLTPGALDDAPAPSVADLMNRAVSQLPPVDDAPADAASVVTTGSAYAPLPVQADQTHYSDGFALLRILPYATTVALRLRPDAPDGTPSRVHFEGETGIHALPPSPDAPDVVGVVQDVVRASLNATALADAVVDVAVVSAVPPSTVDGALAALSIALARAVQSLPGVDAPFLDDATQARDTFLPRVTTALADATGWPMSLAYPLAAHVGEPGRFLLVDTATREHLPVQTDANDALKWALLDVGETVPGDAALHRTRADQAASALSILQESETFADLRTFRELEHRHLNQALDLLPPELTPVAQHLVLENRRVQKHVGALRRGDWQMVGALLLMSHASTRDAWDATGPRADTLVRCAESLTLSGLYGAGMTSRGGALLATGRPLPFNDALADLADAYQQRVTDAPPLHILRA